MSTGPNIRTLQANVKTILDAGGTDEEVNKHITEDAGLTMEEYHTAIATLKDAPQFAPYDDTPEDPMEAPARIAGTDIEIPGLKGMVPMGRGMMDFYQGAKQNFQRATGGKEGAQEYTDQVNKEIGLYDAGYKQHHGDDFDWQRLGGNVATPLIAAPAAAPTVAGQAALGGAVGALQGASMFNPENSMENQAWNTAVGGGGGTILAPLVPAVLRGGVNAVKKGGNYLAQGLRSLKPELEITIRDKLDSVLLQQGIDLTKLPEAMQKKLITEAQEQFHVTGEITPEQLIRKMDIETVVGEGKAMNAQTTRDPNDWTAQENLQKTEANLPKAQAGEMETITGRKLDQNTSMMDFADEITETIYEGAPVSSRSTTTFQATEKGAEALKIRAKELGKVVTKAYEVAKETVGAYADLPKEKFAATAMEVLEDFGKEVPGPIIKMLNNYGINRMGVVEGEKAFTVIEGDKLAKLINKWEDVSFDKPATKETLRLLRNALRGAFNDLGEGGNEAAKNFKKAWGVASKRFDELETKQVAALLKDKTDTAKFIETRIQGGNPKEIKQLKDSILKSQDGQAIWNDMRAKVWDSLVNKASSNRDKAFQGKRLSDELKKIGEDRLKILFPNEMEMIGVLMRASKDMTMEVPLSAPNYSNTTPAAQAAIGKALRLLPFGKEASDVVNNVADTGLQTRQVAAALRGEAVNKKALELAQKKETDALVLNLMKGFRGSPSTAGASSVTQPEGRR